MCEMMQRSVSGKPIPEADPRQHSVAPNFGICGGVAVEHSVLRVGVLCAGMGAGLSIIGSPASPATSAQA